MFALESFVVFCFSNRSVSNIPVQNNSVSNKQQSQLRSSWNKDKVIRVHRRKFTGQGGSIVVVTNLSSVFSNTRLNLTHVPAQAVGLNVQNSTSGPPRKDTLAVIVGISLWSETFSIHDSRC